MKNTLLENFYSEISSTFTENQTDFKCLIRLNEQHAIYKGHFAVAPITPGVCLTQIIKEVLMNKLQKELILTHGDNIKFLAMIKPNEVSELELSISMKFIENTLEVSANYSAEGITYTKFKGKFQILQ